MRSTFSTKTRAMSDAILNDPDAEINHEISSFLYCRTFKSHVDGNNTGKKFYIFLGNYTGGRLPDNQKRSYDVDPEHVSARGHLKHVENHPPIPKNLGQREAYS